MCGEWAQVIQEVINEHHGTGKYGKLDTLGPWNDGQTMAGPMAPWMNLTRAPPNYAAPRTGSTPALEIPGEGRELDHNNVKIGVPNPIPIFETSARVTVVHLERLSQPHLRGY